MLISKYIYEPLKLEELICRHHVVRLISLVNFEKETWCTVLSCTPSLESNLKNGWVGHFLHPLRYLSQSSKSGPDSGHRKIPVLRGSMLLIRRVPLASLHPCLGQTPPSEGPGIPIRKLRLSLRAVGIHV